MILSGTTHAHVQYLPPQMILFGHRYWSSRLYEPSFPQVRILGDSGAMPLLGHCTVWPLTSQSTILVVSRPSLLLHVWPWPAISKKKYSKHVTPFCLVAPQHWSWLNWGTPCCYTTGLDLPSRRQSVVKVQWSCYSFVLYPHSTDPGSAEALLLHDWSWPAVTLPVIHSKHQAVTMSMK